MSTPQEPSAEQCSAHEQVYEDGDCMGYAIWYPQMGGYVGKAVALISTREPDGCIDVYVWHDGEFPFSDGQSPTLLHHCDPNQFVEFGRALDSLNCRSEP